jgi:branched-chain amino acid transport system ATP-binding protein
VNAAVDTNPASALAIADLNAYYGESHILHGVSLDVKRGELVTLLGRNGAGRTTTLKAILGLTGKRTGSIKLPDSGLATALKNAEFFPA